MICDPCATETLCTSLHGARELATRGYSIALVARRADKLEARAHLGVEHAPLLCDAIALRTMLAERTIAGDSDALCILEVLPEAWRPSC